MKKLMIVFGVAVILIVVLFLYPLIKTRYYILDWYSKNIYGVKSIGLMPIGFSEMKYYGGISRIVYIEYTSKVTLGNGATYDDHYLYCIYASHDLGGYKLIGRIHQQ